MTMSMPCVMATWHNRWQFLNLKLWHSKPSPGSREKSHFTANTTSLHQGHPSSSTFLSANSFFIVTTFNSTIIIILSLKGYRTISYFVLGLTPTRFLVLLQGGCDRDRVVDEYEGKKCVVSAFSKSNCRNNSNSSNNRISVDRRGGGRQ